MSIYSPQEWEEGWSGMMDSGVYERGLFGDLMLFGIACGSKKIILIFNTNLDSSHDPIVAHMFFVLIIIGVSSA